MKAYTLKIRGGVEVDSRGKKAGKGALVSEELSGTLGVTQDQYLFQPIGVDLYNDSVTGDKAKTLNAISSDADHVPVVITFEPGITAREGGHIYNGVSGTLRAKPGDNQMAVCYSVENHPSDSRVRIIEDGKVQALTERMGTGGNNVPMILFENHGQDSRYTGPNEVSQTVSATFGMGGNNQPLVVHPFVKSRRAQSDEDYETWVDGDTANTLTTFDNSDVRATTVSCMATQQGGAEIAEDLCPTITASAGMSGNNQPVIAIEGNGTRKSHRGIGYSDDGQMYTLNTIERHAVAYATGNGQTDQLGISEVVSTLDCMHDQKIVLVAQEEPVIAIDRASFNQGENAKFDMQIDLGGVAQTVIARGPNAVCYQVDRQSSERSASPTPKWSETN